MRAPVRSSNSTQSSYHVAPRCCGSESVSARPAQRLPSTGGQPGGGCQSWRAAPPTRLRAVSSVAK
eukprot:3490323-Alexandrium_andersonii.AAC.1